MKELMVLLTLYEDGSSEFSGCCDFCGQFPCKHVGPDGKLSVEAGNYVISQEPMRKVKVQTVNWHLGDGGRPYQVIEQIRNILHDYGYTSTEYETGTDDFVGWLHKIAVAPPSQDIIEFLIKVHPPNLIFWDWKEPRKNMIEDLNEAMETLEVPLKWKIGEKRE